MGCRCPVHDGVRVGRCYLVDEFLAVEAFGNASILAFFLKTSSPPIRS
jgi:hypothetical protein